MKNVLIAILSYNSDRFTALSKFYREKNLSGKGYGIFSTFAAESFPEGWLKALETGVWNETGVYGDNFRKCFELTSGEN